MTSASGGSDGEGLTPQQPYEYPPLQDYGAGSSAQPNYPPPMPPQYGAGYPPPPPPGQYPPPPGAYPDPSAPYGRDPLTGEPLSDKSKVIAGLLQLIGLFGFLGIGRIYLGHVAFGIAQLLIGIIGGFILGLLTCGIGFALPAVWGIVDAVLILTGKVRDPQGRPLRDGT